jgi:glycosyltransferase involved in cell wall biosynthesis
MSENSSKHILIISQYFYPEQFRINDLATEWGRRGYEVTVITGIPNYPKGKFYPGYGIFTNRKGIYNGVRIIRLPLIPRGQSSFMMVLNYMSFVISGFFWSVFTRIQADYVFIFEVSPMTQALPGIWYSNRKKIPCYIYVQDLWPENIEIVAGIHNKVIINTIDKMVDYIYGKCTRIFATSPSFCANINDRGIPEGKIEYWPQYAEEFYKPIDNKSSLIPQDGVLNVTFTGNIGTAQGLDILVETAVLLKNENILVRFNIIGDGRNKANFINNIKLSNVNEYFNNIEWQPSELIPSILAASDAAFLSFSNNQLFSMTIPAKLQSYIACGIPIIGSVIGESKRIIEEAQCGLTCDIGDSYGLKDIIMKFISLSDSERKKMADNAVTYSNNHFNRTKLIDYIIGFFY